MGAQVGIALERMREVLETGDAAVAAEAVAADDQVDAMLVSLTEQVYDLIRRESPVASDLRYLVSVLRVLEEFERIADLSLRVVKHAAVRPTGTADEDIQAALISMADISQTLFRIALTAWSSQDPEAVADLAIRKSSVDEIEKGLVERILRLEGPEAVGTAVTAVLVSRSLERIADHTVIVGERPRYLLTGNPEYLASEIR